MKSDLEKKILRIEFNVYENNTFEDKYLMLLVNNKKIDLQAERTSKDPLLKEYTSVHFFPFTLQTPYTNVVTMQRQQFYERPTEWGYATGFPGKRYDYLTTDDSLMYREAMSNIITKPDIKSIIEF